MIENPSKLDKMVESMTDDDDILIYIRHDQEDDMIKGLICGDEEGLEDALFTMCLSQPQLRNILHNVLICVEEYEVENN